MLSGIPTIREVIRYVYSSQKVINRSRLKENCGIAVADTLAFDIIVDDKGIKFAVTDQQTQRLSEWPIWTNCVLLFTSFPMQSVSS
jgi:hypothetical protein